MKTGDRTNKDQLTHCGFRFSCFYANCEVWIGEEQIIFWNVSTQLIEMILRNY